MAELLPDSNNIVVSKTTIVNDRSSGWLLLIIFILSTLSLLKGVIKYMFEAVISRFGGGNIYVICFGGGGG